VPRRPRRGLERGDPRARCDCLTPLSDHSFDAVVLGAGPAGEVCAGRLAAAGLEVAIVEGHLIGGECSYYACMPSKALLRPAQALAEVRRVPGAREAVTGELDASAVLERRDEVIHDLDDGGQADWLEDAGVALFRGHGRLDGERRVQVSADLLTARRAVVVAVGSGAALPPIPGLAEAEPWTNREATTAKVVPGRLIVLGGGVVGVEMAQAWASLGAAVTVVEALPRVLSREEPFVSDQVTAALEAIGVDVRTGARACAVRRHGEVTLELEGGDAIGADELLVAAGRRPHSGDIGLDSVGLPAGVEIEVDDELRVPGLPWLYAVGDVNGRSLLTHMGKHQARLAADRIAGKQAPAARGSHGGPPCVVLTDRQVAAVGHTLASAQEAGLRVRAVDHPTSQTAGGSFYGRDAAGTARIVVDEDRRLIVGATFTGPDVADFLHAATIAVVGEVPLDRLWHAVPAFPTRSEVWLKLMEAYGL